MKLSLHNVTQKGPARGPHALGTGRVDAQNEPMPGVVRPSGPEHGRGVNPGLGTGQSLLQTWP